MDRSHSLPTDLNFTLPVTALYLYHPGDPGKYSGPPETCYPSEPAEVELVDVLYEGKSVLEIIPEKVLDTLCQQLLEEHPALYEPDYDPIYAEEVACAF